LSADTAASAKPLAFVAFTSAGNSGQSFAVPSVMLIAVMTLVTQPTIACALIQVCSFISRPYLWSYQRR
jgi:hypothetical protein